MRNRLASELRVLGPKLTGCDLSHIMSKVLEFVDDEHLEEVESLMTLASKKMLPTQIAREGGSAAFKLISRWSNERAYIFREQIVAEAREGAKFNSQGFTTREIMSVMSGVGYQPSVVSRRVIGAVLRAAGFKQTQVYSCSTAKTERRWRLPTELQKVTEVELLERFNRTLEAARNEKPTELSNLI